MKLFLGNAPWYDENDPSNYGVRAGSRWPHFQKIKKGEKRSHYIPFPHFLASAAAVLLEEKEDVLLVDGIAEGISVDDFINKIEEFDPVIVVLEISTPSLYYDLRIAEKIKIVCKDVLIAFCGLHAPMQSEEFMRQYSVVDFVLFGEYEFTLRKLVQCYQKKQHLQDVTGLIFRDGTKKIVKNDPRELIDDLDSLPFYACRFLPMLNYSDAPCHLPEPSVQLWTSRGCPFSCIFCAWPQIMYQGNRYRVRSIGRTLDELELLVKQYGFHSFYFDDDTVNIDKNRMIELCREIRKRSINLPWAIMSRADMMDKELLDCFKDAGLYSLKYGVESGDQGLLDRSGKRLDLDKVREIIFMTKEVGIKVHLTFSFGLPGETKETMEKTINFALELNPDAVQFSLITPFPGSDYYQVAREKGWLVTEDWSLYNGSSSAVIRSDTLSASDLEEGVKEAYRRWRERFNP